MEKLEIYNAVREVPKEAQKTIGGGKLKGMTDINPMWRIKMLTELFGPCGFGWYTEITKQWLEPYGNATKTFVNINLYVKYGEEWSKPIQGTGGSSFASMTKNGVEVSDECYKMAYTDAISVACKALGMGADIYWQGDRTKYDQQTELAKQGQAYAQPQVSKQTIKALEDAKKALEACKSRQEVVDLWNGVSKEVRSDKEFTSLVSAKGSSFNA